MVFEGMKLNWFSGMLLFLGGNVMAANTSSLVYIGTYTGGKSKGIYLSKFDASSGKLSAPELAIETKNPSFLCLHPNRKYLYSVGEIDSEGAVQRDRASHLEPSVARAGGCAAEGATEQRVGSGGVTTVRQQDAGLKLHGVVVVEGHPSEDRRRSGVDGFAERARVVKPRTGVGSVVQPYPRIPRLEECSRAIGNDRAIHQKVSGRPQNRPAVLQRSATG